MPSRDDVLPIGPCVAPLGAFLRSRRERLTPPAVGLPLVGRRRTAGLRREEVAQLAGISPAWYTHLEQGRNVHPSREVLDAVAEALRLDPGERAYLFQLAYGPRRDGDRRTPALPAVPHVRPAPAALCRLLAALGPMPALLIDRCWDLVACNAAIVAVLPNFGPGRTTSETSPFNLVEYVLTNVAWRAAMHEWAQVARLAVDGLRASLAGVAAGEAAGDHPLSTRAAALVARLTASSPEFRAWWPLHGLWTADRPVAHVYEHPEVGRLEVDGTMLDVRSAPGLTLLTYVPCDPVSAERLGRLAAAVAPETGATSA